MADEQQAQDAPDADEQQHDEGKRFTPDDVKRIVEERLARDRKSRDLSPEEVRELKAQAAKAQAEADASKTDAQRAAEKLAAMEARIAETERQALVASVRAEHGISEDDAALFLTGSDAGQLKAQGKRLAELVAASAKRGTSRDGANPRPANDDKRGFMQQLIRNAG